MIDGSSDWALAERARRREMWLELRARGNADRATPALLRELGLYGGMQGIWVDLARTRSPSTPNGATVSLYHGGDYYPDDLDDRGLIYHAPSTRRGDRDSREVSATVRAGELGLPVFVITKESGGFRRVREASISSYAPELRLFYVVFQTTISSVPITVPDAPFVLVTSDNPKTSTVVRYGRTGFRYGVLALYGGSCAVCDWAIPQAIDVAHLLDASKGGASDARNGLVLCPNHHRAFDARLFAFDPATTRIRYRTAGPGKAELAITRESLTHLLHQPHVDALTWRWNDFLARSGEF